MTKKRILITGGAGFIGFHMAKSLQARGDHVIGIDNFNSYYDPGLKQARANQLRKLGIEIKKDDLTDRSHFISICEDFAPTHILHLAAQAGVRYARTDPDAYLKSNVEGFLSVLEGLRKFNHVKLIYASSSSVYGLNEKVPFSEKDRVEQPANLYAATKRMNELMAYSYHHLYGLSATGLRFFTVYGPWGRPDMAYYSFTEMMMRGEPIRLFNQGKMSRDFTYIDDIVEGTKAAIDLGAPLEIFNLGNHEPIELMKFVTLLESAVGKKAKIELMDASPGEVESTYADIGHAKEKLGFIPKTKLADGLQRFVEWYRDWTKND